MWKKKIACVLAVMTLCGVMAVSADEYTILEKTEKVETTVYGEPQTGSLNERILALDKLLNGESTVSGSLQEKTNKLYKDVYGNSGSDLSLVSAVNLMQWQYSGQITEDPIFTRIGELEEGIDGKEMAGSLINRINVLRHVLLGSTRYISQDVVIPSGTIVRMRTLSPLHSKTAEEGDIVYFAVDEDVMVDDIVAIPRGMEATGTITKARKSGMFGKNGKIEITYRTVRAGDNTPVPLILGEKAKEEYKRAAGAVGASAAGAIILGPVGLVGGLFVHGSEVDLPTGTNFLAEVEEDTEVMGFYRTGTADDLRTADMAASGVVVADWDAEEEEDDEFYGEFTPVEQDNDSEISDEHDEVVVTITSSEYDATGEIDE